MLKEIISGAGTEKGVSHASNICCLRDGRILAAWFSGSAEGADDVGIWFSIRENGAWRTPAPIAHETNEPHWNPVLYEREDGAVLLFYKVGREISRWRTLLKISTDRGETWSAPRELVPGDEGGRGPVRCKAIRLSDGSILAGGSTENGIWRAFADRSSDGGKTWARSDYIGIHVAYHGENTAESSSIAVSAQSFYGRGVIQPTLWESEPGVVHMLLRSTECEIFRSNSYDGGKTWSKARGTGLPNNNSGIDVARHGSGKLFLCSNPVAENWGPRTPLTIQSSMDNGITWTTEYVLEEDSGEYSYPCVICRGDKLMVSYTFDRKGIAYREIRL